ncbi:hypothetical protein L596_027764 [Steinernema carpocapsae]|uniref:Uncharacterized protein n=1 Tax=Steinernema carpocapsae TaxID=34508 RepID=A0A4U5LWH8_STECR|nr:hypothetical protein L596_027764 [Steinernema carpocapsae]
MRHRTGSPLFSCFVLLYCLHFVLGQYYGGYGLGYPYGMMGGGGYGMGGGYGLGGYSGYGGYGGDYGYGARPVMVRRVIYTMPGYGGGYGGYGGYGAYGGGMYPGIYGAKTVAAKV